MDAIDLYVLNCKIQVATPAKPLQYIYIFNRGKMTYFIAISAQQANQWDESE